MRVQKNLLLNFEDTPDDGLGFRDIVHNGVIHVGEMLSASDDAVKVSEVEFHVTGSVRTCSGSDAMYRHPNSNTGNRKLLTVI